MNEIETRKTTEKITKIKGCCFFKDNKIGKSLAGFT